MDKIKSEYETFARGTKDKKEIDLIHKRMNSIYGADLERKGGSASPLKNYN